MKLFRNLQLNPPPSAEPGNLSLLQETSENRRDLGRESDPERGVGVKLKKWPMKLQILAPNAPKLKKREDFGAKKLTFLIKAIAFD